MRKQDSRMTLAARYFLNAALGGLLCLNLGCNGEMRERVSKYRSEMQSIAEKEDHLASAEWDDENDASEEGKEEQPVEQSHPAEQIVAEQKTEPESPASESVKAETSESRPATVEPSAVKGEVAEKSFEEPSTFDKPEKLLPNERPAWVTAADKLSGEEHTLVVNTSPYSTYEGSLTKLPEFAFVRFAEYSKKSLGIDVEEFKSITPEWVSQRLIKGKDSEFVAERMDNGTPTYVAWAKLEIDPATRHELEGMFRRLQWYPRSLRVSGFILSALAFFGMAHVGFTAISSVQSKKK